MKQCRACIKEIDEKAIKCPYCQEYQGYRGMNFLTGFLPMLFIFPFLAYTLWNSSNNLRSKSFDEYSSKIKISEVNKINDRIVYQIENDTDYKWSRPYIKIIFTDHNNAVIGVKDEQSYSFMVLPHSKSLVEVRVDEKLINAPHSASLISMDSKNY